MKNVLLAIFLLSTVVSCSDSSSNPSPPPVYGKDGVKEMGIGALRYHQSGEVTSAGNINNGSLAWEKGKDFHLVYGFQFGDDLEGSVLFKELAIGSKAAQALPGGTCPLSAISHHWVMSRKGVDTKIAHNEVVKFGDNSILYLVVETGSNLACVKVLYGFTTTQIELRAAPTPTPKPTPTPIPAVPAGSEAVVVVRPNTPENFSITYEGNGTNNFKYKVSLLIDGKTFGKSENLDKILIAIYDKTFTNYVTPWTEIVKFEPAGTLSSEYRLEFALNQFSAPAYVIDRQKELVLTFAINSDSNSPLPYRSLELDKYCSSYSNSFVEIETGKKGCK